MKKVIMFFCLLPLFGFGQELVVNWDFEDGAIPTERGQIDFAAPWTDYCTHPWLFTSGGSGADLLDVNSLNPLIQVPDNSWGSIDERNGNNRYAHLWQTQNTPPEIETAGERLKGFLITPLTEDSYQTCVWGARATAAIPALSDPYQAFEVYLVNDDDCDDAGKLILTSENMTYDAMGNSQWKEYCANFDISSSESGFYNKIIVKIIEPGAPISFPHTQSIYIDGVSVKKECDDANFEFPSTIEICDGNFEELCGPLSTIGGPEYTYEWWGPDPELEISVLLSTSRCFTPSAYGSYILKLTDEYGCVSFYHFTIYQSYPFLPELENIELNCEPIYPAYAGWHEDPFLDYPCFYELQWTFNGEIVDGETGYNIPYMGLGTYCVYITYSDFTLERCFEAIECCKPNPEFAIAWYMGENPYTIEINNYEDFIPHYDAEVFFLYKDCNNDGMPGPWEFVASESRTDPETFDETILFENLDPNCLYSVTHGVSKFCLMLSFVHVEYVGGSTGLDQKSSLEIRSDDIIKELNLSPNPARDVVHLEVPFKEGKHHLTIYDLSGKIVLQQESEQMNYDLDISALKSGIYIVNASNESTSYSAKLILN